MIFLSTSSPSRFRPNKLKTGDLICYRPLKKTSLVLDVLTHVKNMLRILTLNESGLIQHETINLNYLEIL